MYITSESYGGHYMPTLSKKIVDMNTAGENPILNFKGFAVGNPQTTFYSAIPSGLATYWGHQLVSKPTWDVYEANCLTKGSFNFSKCEELFLEMYMEIGDLNPYALDYPVCTDDNRRKFKSGRNQRNFLLQHLMANADDKIKSAMGMVLKADDYEPCTDDWSVNYLNRADVKSAIHVKGDVEWAQCSRSIKYKQTDGMHSMTPIYNYLIDGNYGLKILVYSGDDDSVCSTEGSQKWIWDLGYDVKGRRWQQYKVANQTAGYVTKWKDTGLTFMTVHGAGHEVPTYQPEIALYLFNEYMAGTLN
jgi:carboxypeptidase C (cathepsin A)